MLPDVPMHFPTAEPGVVYSPRNYDGRYRGPLLARAALAGSENVPAVSLASELGVPSICCGSSIAPGFRPSTGPPRTTASA